MAPRPKKKKGCSGKSTLQHYFGGKVVDLAQPTLHQFIKGRVENVANTVAIGHLESHSNRSELTEENLLQKETLPTNPNESFKLHQAGKATLSTPHRHNPFSKALSLRKEEKLPPFSHKQELSSSVKRKSLSLRKRKLGSPQNYDESNKACSKTHTRESSNQKELTLPRCANYQQPSKTEGMLIMYPEDEDMMKGYSMDTEIMDTFETPKACASCYVSTPKSHKKPLSCFELPKTPTFSPKFSPHVLRSSLAETLSVDKSISLFSTPSQQLEQSVSWSPRSEQKKAKRALFPHISLAESASAVTVHPSSNKEYSFVDDVNFSEFLNSFEAVSETSVLNQTSVINRYLVLEAVTQTSTEVYDNGRYKPELLLRLFEEKTKTEKLCYLRDDWFRTDVIPGDVVQVNAVYDVVNGCYLVDHTDPDSSIVINPDTLISGTSVANSIACTRKSVLAEKFKGPFGGTEAMIMGQLLHQIFQATLTKCQDVGVSLRGVALREAVEEEVRRTLTSLESLDHLYALGMSEADALVLLLEHVPAIEEWCMKFIHSEPQQGLGDIEFKRPGCSETESCVCVTDVMDIEENVWSPRFGLKGKVDVTVNLRERRGKKGVVNSHVPLELKTGKMFHKQGSIEHRAQLILYGLMLSDRYASAPPQGGLLLYLKTKHTHGLSFNAHEKRGLLIARNHLSRYYGNQSGHTSLPGMLMDQHTCKYCPYIQQCALYHRAVESGDEVSSGLGDLFSAQVAHIGSSHLEFFSHWYELLSEEEHFYRAKKPTAPWLPTAQDRDQQGIGLADMLAQPPTFTKSTGRYLQSFTKKPGLAEVSCSVLSISTNDRVVISRQDRTGWAIAIGTVTEVFPGPGVVVLLDKAVVCDCHVLYTVDQVSGHSGGMANHNLADLCASGSERQQRLRELIIDRSMPHFKSNVKIREEDSLSKLNSDQEAAVRKVLAAEDYTLILGMPGTGKTTTIAHLVQVAVAENKTVLLTSYTHSAVDNILLKLKKMGVSFLRLGPPSRIHPTLQYATPSHLCQEVLTVKELEEFYQGQSVVATTCLGVTHPIFARRTFDMCIIDEASQITLPISLGPLKYASTFVLVGDHYQLPPLVQSQKAREGGLDVSLFRYLSECQPSALLSLGKQYRMNREVMEVANSLVYKGRLECGSLEVAMGRLQLPLYPSPAPHGGGDQWIHKALDPHLPVLFLDTDQCSDAGENVGGGQICNRFEAKLVAKLVAKLIEYGMADEEIGVITPLRQQMVLIREKIYDNPGGHIPSLASRHSSMLEVNTVDKYQGRDKECILVSFVRSNKKGNTGLLLQDWRRINVAVTRAKHKLLLVGSSSTLKHVPFLMYLLNLLAKDNQIMSVPNLSY